MADWEYTSLKDYVDMLDKHVLAIMDEVRRSKRKGAGMYSPCLTIQVGLTQCLFEDLSW